MKADYNFLSKLLLDARLIQKVESKQAFLDELKICYKLHRTIDIELNGKLVEDIMRQLQRPGTITELMQLHVMTIYYTQ